MIGAVDGDDVVIVDAVRTPLGKRAGALSHMHPVDLGAHVLSALVDRTGIDSAVVGDVVWGCVTTAGEQSSNIARWSVLAAGWPESVPATTIDRACGSSQQALTFAAAGVRSGQYDVVVAGGVESMSRSPMGSTRPAHLGEARGPRVRQRYPDADFSQGTAAELVAERWRLTRTDLDAYSLLSHERAAQARASGAFDKQVIPVPDAEGTSWVTQDEGIRVGGTLESLGRLRPAFNEDGTVTAGNSSQIADGASAVLVMSARRAAELGCVPMARFRTFALAGVDPVLMLTGPVPATARALALAGLSIGDIEAVEVNEAFACVPLAWLAETGADPGRLNALGGAIALGHPLGATGARLCTSLVHHMVDRQLQFGLQAICEAGGMANAMILELL